MFICRRDIITFRITMTLRSGEVFLRYNDFKTECRYKKLVVSEFLIGEIMGRIFWTLRRTSLYALVALLFCVFNEISFKSIVSKAFPFSGSFDLFYTSMVWSGPALLAFFILSWFMPKQR